MQTDAGSGKHFILNKMFVGRDHNGRTMQGHSLLFGVPFLRKRTPKLCALQFVVLQWTGLWGLSTILIIVMIMTTDDCYHRRLLPPVFGQGRRNWLCGLCQMRFLSLEEHCYLSVIYLFKNTSSNTHYPSLFTIISELQWTEIY